MRSYGRKQLMRKNVFVLLLGFVLSLTLAACGGVDDGGVTESNEEDASVSASESQDANQEAAEPSEEETDQSGEDLTLPDNFPADFPLPENIVITEVDDDSDDEEYSYSIQFTFDPNIDLDATFEMYSNYAEQVGYNTAIGGEEYFADGIFQYGGSHITICSLSH